MLNTTTVVEKLGAKIKAEAGSDFIFDRHALVAYILGPSERPCNEYQHVGARKITSDFSL